MENAGKYILALTAVFGVLYGLRFVLPKEPAPLTTHAVDPDLHFTNSRSYFRDKDYSRGLEHLIKAMNDIRTIEEDLDSASTALLEESIADLEIVKRELEHDSLVIDDINISYSEALNALTEAEIKMTQALLRSNHRHDAMVALKYGMMHLKNTLTFTQGEKKASEIRIHDEINEILNDESLSDDEIEERLAHIVLELDSLLEDNLHTISSSTVE